MWVLFYYFFFIIFFLSASFFTLSHLFLHFLKLQTTSYFRRTAFRTSARLLRSSSWIWYTTHSELYHICLSKRVTVLDRWHRNLERVRGNNGERSSISHRSQEQHYCLLYFLCDVEVEVFEVWLMKNMIWTTESRGGKNHFCQEKKRQYVL